MCLKTRIEQEIAKKAEIDATIAKLEKILDQKSPVMAMVRDLFFEISVEAPEELATIWGEFLAIGSQYNLAVQPLAAEELRQWEADRAELEKLKMAASVWQQQLEENEAEVAEQDSAWGELCDERDDLEVENKKLKTELEEARSQLQRSQMQTTPSLSTEEEVLTEAKYDAAVGEELALDDDELPDSILALTVLQPWASLVGNGKNIETRSWSTNHRGLLAIHAAQRPVDWSKLSEDEYALPEGKEWPLGAVVAIAHLVDCIQMTPEFIAAQTQQERELGIWQPGRFAWVLENVQPLDPPVPAKGKQGLWKWERGVSAAELEASGSCGTEEMTELQKLLLNNSNFTFEELGVSVAIESVMAPADDIVDFESEEARISVTNTNGLTREYYEDAQTFVYQRRNDHIEQAALGYAQHFLNELNKEATIKGKIARWNSAQEEVSNKALQIPIGEAVEPKPEQLNPAVEQVEEAETPITETADKELAEPQTETHFTVMGLQVQVYPQYEIYPQNANETHLVGATFRFLNSEHTLVFAKSLLKTEIGDRSWKTCAYDLIQDYKDEKAAERDRRYSDFNKIFEIQKFKVDVQPRNKGNEFAGANFKFYKIREDDVTICEANLTYSKSLTAVECGKKHPKELATEIIEAYWQKLRETQEKEADFQKKEDDFVELVKLNPWVGYLKQKVGQDAGKILKTYVAFANKDENGDRTPTNSKSRAQKWREYFHSSFESCGWKVGEVCKVKRMLGEPGKLELKYEIPIVGASMSQIEKLAQENFSLLPGQFAVPVVPLAPPTSPEKTYTVTVNGHWLASGTEEEMRSRFLEEFKLLGGLRLSVALQTGSEVVESYSINDFKFVPVEKFDSRNPEFEVQHTTPLERFTVWKKVAVGETDATWRNSVYPYVYYTYREGAAVDAVRRLLKIQETQK